MSLAPTPALATSLKALTRSLLFALGMDHVLIDFLACAAIGTVTVLLTVLPVNIGIPRRSKAAIRRTTR